MFLFLVLCSVIVSGITYYKIQKSAREGLTGQSSTGIYDLNYIGGLGWGSGYGDWQGNVVIANGWTPPGWSVLWKGEEVGGTGVDQVFHETSLEGEFGGNLDSPSTQDTLYRLGGGLSLLYADIGNSIVPPSGPPDDSYGKVNGDLTYYAPGSFMYGPDNYVPSYATSVLLSPMLGVNAPLKQITGEGQGGGNGAVINGMVDSVCSPDSGASVLDKEAYCQQLSPEEASNKTCCVALSGKYSMAGNEQGPFNRAIYTDPMIQGVKDYYIHLGKCYGNCPSSYGTYSEDVS